MSLSDSQAASRSRWTDLSQPTIRFEVANVGDATLPKARCFAAQGGGGHADGHRAVQVVTIALKNIVLLGADFDVQVARWAAIGARLSVARAADAHAVVDARRDFDFQGFVGLDLAVAAAWCAGVGDDLARAPAMRAGLLHAEKALAHTIANKVESAYRRGDLLEPRRQLLLTWENYCLSSCVVNARFDLNKEAA